MEDFFLEFPSAVCVAIWSPPNTNCAPRGRCSTVRTIPHITYEATLPGPTVAEFLNFPPRSLYLILVRNASGEHFSSLITVPRFTRPTLPLAPPFFGIVRPLHEDLISYRWVYTLVARRDRYPPVPTTVNIASEAGPLPT